MTILDKGTSQPVLISELPDYIFSSPTRDEDLYAFEVYVKASGECYHEADSITSWEMLTGISHNTNLVDHAISAMQGCLKHDQLKKLLSEDNGYLLTTPEYDERLLLIIILKHF